MVMGRADATPEGEWDETQGYQLTDAIHQLIDRADGISPDAPALAAHQHELFWRYHLRFLRFTLWHVGSALLLLIFCLALETSVYHPLLQPIQLDSALWYLEPTVLTLLVIEALLHRRLLVAERRCARMAVEERLAEFEVECRIRGNGSPGKSRLLSLLQPRSQALTTRVSGSGSGRPRSPFDPPGSPVSRRPLRDATSVLAERRPTFHPVPSSGVPRRATPEGSGVPRRATPEGSDIGSVLSSEGDGVGRDTSERPAARSDSRPGMYRFDVRRPPSAISSVLYAVESVLVGVLLIVCLLDVGKQSKAVAAMALLLPRAARFVVHRAAAFMRQSTERDDLLSMLRLTGVPVRSTVEVLAFLFAAAGALLIIVGGLTLLETHRISFLGATLPGDVADRVTFTGAMMMLTAAVASLAAYVSSYNSVLLATIGAVGVSGILTAGFFEGTAKFNLHNWRSSIAVGRASFFSDAGLERVAGTQQTIKRFDLDGSGRLELAESELLLEELKSEHTAQQSEKYSTLLTNWHELRQAFEERYADCAPTVYNSSRVLLECAAAEERAAVSAARAAAAAIAAKLAAQQNSLLETALDQANPWQHDASDKMTVELETAGAHSKLGAAINGTVLQVCTELHAVELCQAAFEGAGTVLMDAQRFSEDALRAGGSFVESSAKGVAMWWATTPFAAMGDALSGGSDQGDQAAEEKHAHAVCTFEPPPNQFVVYCSGSYLERYGYTEAWHADGQSAQLGRFDALASRWCLNEPTHTLLARLTTPAFMACFNSTWWPSPDPTLGTPLDELSGSSVALGDGSAAREVFRRLGQGELPLSAKALFCLCERSPEYVQMVQGYTDTLTWASLPFTPALFFLLAILPIALCLCLCCPIAIRITDTSKYYDKDLV